MDGRDVPSHHGHAIDLKAAQGDRALPNPSFHTDALRLASPAFAGR